MHEEKRTLNTIFSSKSFLSLYMHTCNALLSALILDFTMRSYKCTKRNEYDVQKLSTLTAYVVIISLGMYRLLKEGSFCERIFKCGDSCYYWYTKHCVYIFVTTMAGPARTHAKIDLIQKFMKNV